MTIRRAARLDGVEISLIRQINALATPLSINLGIGEPNVEPTPAIRALAADVAREAPWRYSPNPGFPELRRLIAEEEAGQYDPQDEICVTAGTEEGLYAVMQSFVDPGDQVLVPDPGFVSYPVLARLAGGTPVPYALDPDGWDVDFDQLERVWRRGAKAIVVNSPSNPTGAVLGEASIHRIVDMAAERGTLVIADEVYRDIHYGDPPPSFAGRGGQVIALNGMSKSQSMTGLRLGWVVGPGDLIREVVKAHQYIATCASVFSQQLAVRILSAPAVRAEWLDALRSAFRSQRDAALAAAGRALKVEIAPPGGAFYLFAPVPACETADLARRLAIDAAVLTIPGSAFGRRGEGFLRISYAAPVDQIQKGFERIGRFL
ncbi:MAG TPA: pyridoxal phosphate-dependent aminotransferase, partial [Thermoanaerobaculia bacterium]|nr:pyridoxal phosphate-dependent aminotransferase [Thermoanaerobaculia bacterium]